MKKTITVLVAILICMSCITSHGVADTGKIQLVLPSCPFGVIDKAYSGSVDGELRIDNISYEISDLSSMKKGYITITFSGTVVDTKKQFGIDIDYKIYDSEGYVVYNGGTYVSSALEKGEKFKVKTTTTSLPYGTYTLKITNVGSSSTPSPTPTVKPTAAPTPQPTKEPSPAVKPEYKFVSASYNGNAVTGKLLHTEGTGIAKNLRVRVTFFITGNYYMATAGLVEADGSFEVEGVGPMEYITILACENTENGGRTIYDATDLFIN